VHSHRFLIDHFLFARRNYGFGDQHRHGEHPGTMAVVMTNGSAGRKWMNTSRPNARFRDRTSHFANTVTADSSGWAEFPCPDGSVSVWLPERAVCSPNRPRESLGYGLPEKRLARPPAHALNRIPSGG
jgi:Domain of unknown function (DUF1939)